MDLRDLEKCMKKALKLARKGAGKVLPNPMVGAVLIDNNGKLLAQGFHEKYGENHAEINAILDAKNRNIDIKSSTLVVNLEPCSHFGKTPPCVQSVINSGISRVVIGTSDPNRLVSGLGMSQLKAANIEVLSGILQQECIDLNKMFFVNKINNRPFISSKIATSIDFKLADFSGKSKWITSQASRNFVHSKIRTRFDAILTSSKTLIADNAKFNVRIDDKAYEKNLIIIDKNADLIQLHTKLLAFNLPRKKSKIFIITTQKNRDKYKEMSSDYIEILTLDSEDGENFNMQDILPKFLEFGIFSILVEAGGRFNSSLFEQDLIDEIHNFTAPILFSDKFAISPFESVHKVRIESVLRFDLMETKVLEQDVYARYLKPIIF